MGKREHYYTKIVLEVVAQFHDEKFFSIIDAKKEYCYFPLDKQSSLLTNSPFGRYRFMRFPFGLIVSQDVFQKELDTVLKWDEASAFLHTYTPECVKPDNKKVSAILAMKPPDNAKDLQSFLRSMNYLIIWY